MDKVTISAEVGCIATNADQLHFKDVRILPSRDTVYSFNNAGSINITRGFMPPDAKVFVRAQGRQSKGIIISETTLPDSPDIIVITDDAPENAVIKK